MALRIRKTPKIFIFPFSMFPAFTIPFSGLGIAKARRRTTPSSTAAPLKNDSLSVTVGGNEKKWATTNGREARCQGLRTWPIMLLLLAAITTGAQAQSAPLQVMRSSTLEQSFLVMPTIADAPGEVYVDDVRIRVDVENNTRIYRVFHRGVTHTLYVALDAPLGYAAYDLNRNRFERLSSGLRVELEDLGDEGLLNRIVAAAGGTGGKAYPMLGFALVHLSPEDNPVNAAQAIEALPGVTDVRLTVRRKPRVPR